MQYIIGLTGLIGSGKSLVASVFNELGVKTIDTDAIAHAITCQNGVAVSSIAKLFGQSYIDSQGSLNRSKMRELVFTYPIERRRLEAIVHPLIYNEALTQIKRTEDKYIIVMVPLLFKSLKYLNLIHRSIFVDCKESILINRVSKRSELTKNEIRSIIKAQMPRALQLQLCDEILDNSGDHINIREQVIKLNDRFKKLFQA